MPKPPRRREHAQAGDPVSIVFVEKLVLKNR